jgi:hypothetical protein
MAAVAVVVAAAWSGEYLATLATVILMLAVGTALEAVVMLFKIGKGKGYGTDT